MRLFEIIDEELSMSVGVLLHYEKENTVIIELRNHLDEWTAPMLFMNHVKKGVYTIPRDISFLWVKERVIPSGRQNINSILTNHRLKEYDEMTFLELAEGRCSQDSLYIRKLEDIPEFVKERYKHNLKECQPLDGGMVLCFFEDGTTKKVDLATLRNCDGVDKVLLHTELFKSCKLGTDGYFITFDDSIDVGRDALYDAGEVVPLGLKDFITFVNGNLLDSAQCCDILECSRQNISYLAKKGQLSPVRENVKGNIYLKGDVLRNKW